MPKTAGNVTKVAAMQFALMAYNLERIAAQAENFIPFEYSLIALSYSLVLKNLLPAALHASASTGGFSGIAGAGAGVGC
jgi:hypothetical protein